MTEKDLHARVEALERIGREADAHRLAVVTLLNALILKTASASGVLSNFRTLIDAFSQNAPSSMDQEQIVEFLAQAEQIALALEVLMQHTKAAPPQPPPLAST